MTVKSKAKRGMFWVGSARIATKAMSFVEFLILAKLLIPEYFGLVATADLAINALMLFQEMGFGAALIYRKEDVEEASDTAFWTVLGTSTMLYVVAFLASPLIAAIFSRDPAGAEQVTQILRVLALTLVISALGKVHYTLLVKEMDFQRKVIPEFLGQLGGAICSLTLAFLGFGAWSIVYGRILEASAMTILVWLFYSWRPRFRFNRRLAQELFVYAKHILGSQVLVFFITNLDDAFVARLAGPAALGLYGLAYKLSNMPATEVSRVVAQVMFPTFSTIREDKAAFKRAFLTSTRYVALLAIPISLCIIFFAPDFVLGVYGRKWAGAVIPLQLLVVYGLARSIAVNMGNAIKAGGKPQWITAIATWRLATMAVFLYPATARYGIVGVSSLSAIVAIIDFGISVWITRRIVGTQVVDWVRLLTWPFLAATGAAAIAKLAFQNGINMLRVILAFPLAGALMMGSYVVILWLIDGNFRRLTADIIAYGLRLWGRRRAAADSPAK